MALKVVDRTVGSRRHRALPGADFGNFNLWFPKSPIKPAAARVGNADL